MIMIINQEWLYKHYNDSPPVCGSLPHIDKVSSLLSLLLLMVLLMVVLVLVSGGAPSDSG